MAFLAKLQDNIGGNSENDRSHILLFTFCILLKFNGLESYLDNEWRNNCLATVSLLSPLFSSATSVQHFKTLIGHLHEIYNLQVSPPYSSQGEWKEAFDVVAYHSFSQCLTWPYKRADSFPQILDNLVIRNITLYFKSSISKINHSSPSSTSAPEYSYVPLK